MRHHVPYVQYLFLPVMKSSVDAGDRAFAFCLLKAKPNIEMAA
jgi:hypothetical protein